MKKIGIINPWPGSPSAESEVVLRLIKGFELLGIEGVEIDNYGRKVNNDKSVSEEIVKSDEFEFFISNHFCTHKALDGFYYLAIWNPPEILLKYENYVDDVTDNYIMNDDYLIYDEGGMYRHLQCILMNKHRTIEGASELVASFPSTYMMEPHLEDPKMFYCGMNWDVLENKEGRHESLFKLLDQTNQTYFFGPNKVDAWGGIRPWAGYRNYKHEIPFDGFSIIKELNNCGVCLVLASDVHRRAGAVTNRLYEACTAGCVIISDHNAFMDRYFGDAALFIDYDSKCPDKTYKQIMEAFEWIKQNKQEALQIANRAQSIFVKKFCLEVQLQGLVDNHRNRLDIIKKDLFAQNNHNKIMIIHVADSEDKKELLDNLGRVINNIKRQYYDNMELRVVVDKKDKTMISKQLSESEIRYSIVESDIMDRNGHINTTEGKLIYEALKPLDFDFFILSNGDEIWFKDHITTLIRTVEDTESMATYSGRLDQSSSDGLRRPNSLDGLDWYSVYYIDKIKSLLPGQILFKKEVFHTLEDYQYDYLDGYEHYAFLAALLLKNNVQVEPTRRMTFVFDEKSNVEKGQFLSKKMQRRIIQDAYKPYFRKKGMYIKQATEIGLFEKMPVKMVIKFMLVRWLIRGKIYTGDKNKLLKKYMELKEKIDKVYSS